MKLKSKTINRNFKLKIHFDEPQIKNWANEVIKSIENDELLIFDPKDRHALDYEFDKESGDVLFLSKANTPTSIKEWLSIGCQSIRWSNDPKDHSRDGACYRNNGAKVLWPQQTHFEPPGPAAFIGDIIVFRSLKEMISHYNSIAENIFKCIIAHELVHVFDHMRFLVPAFMDWPNFWSCVLDEGAECDALSTTCETLGFFVDSYGKQNELSRLEMYWPSQAKVWFDALRQKDKSA